MKNKFKKEAKNQMKSKSSKVVTKRIMSMILSFVMVFSLMNGLVLVENAEAANKTQQEALDWVKSQVGKGLDYDGAYGNQCVDLILYYYSYLGVSTSSGNASDYTWNSLPSGWQRIPGAVPQPGDILVYTGDYGHVAIYESDYSTYHQNFNYHSYVERVTIKYNSLSNPYWGVIRPDFKNITQSPTVTLDTSSWRYSIGWTNAIVCAKINNPNAGTIGTVGCYLYDANGNHIYTHQEQCASGYVNHTTVELWTDFNVDANYYLKTGTKYQYVLYAYIDGNLYQSEWASFTTGGPTPVPEPTQKPTVEPTTKPTARPTVKPISTPNPSPSSNPSHTHVKKTKITPATFEEDGERVEFCTTCNKNISSETIYSISDIWIDDEEYVFSKAKIDVVPEVYILDREGNEISKEYYSLDYPNESYKVRDYCIEIEFKGKYEGYESVYFTILPRPTKIIKLKASYKAIKVKWKQKTAQSTGYQIQYSTSKKFNNKKTITIDSDIPTTKSIKKLASCKKYYVRVRTVCKVEGEEYYSKWSTIKSIKTK